MNIKNNNNLQISSSRRICKNVYDNEIGDYILKQTIGEGAFSKVKLAIKKETKSVVAIKIMDKSQINQSDKIRILREIKILSILDHPNVIQVYEIFEDRLFYYIVMEYCPEGDLFNYIIHKKRLSEEEASLLFYQIINGVEYIHNKKISHRDLKPENILLLSNRTIKIIDFGLSNYYISDRKLKTPCGSPCYAPPEMIKNIQYNGKSSDIWSIGIILYTMVCGCLPFEDSDNQKLFNKILNDKPVFPNFLSSNIKVIISKMLNKDPMKRIKIEEIKKNHFYQQGSNIFRIKFSTIYDDLYSIKNQNSQINTFFESERNTTVNKNRYFSNLPEDLLPPLLSISSREENEEEEKNIWSKNLYEDKLEKRNITAKVRDASVEKKLVKYNSLNSQKNSKLNFTQNESIKIKVNKCANANQEKIFSYDSRLNQIPKGNTTNNKGSNGYSFGLTNYNKYKNRISLTKSKNSYDKKAKLGKINIDINHKPNLSLDKRNNNINNYNYNNKSLNLTFYNIIQGKSNTNTEIKNCYSNKRTNKCQNNLVKQKQNYSMSCETKRGKRNINKSIDQASIFDKFSRRFNFKTNRSSPNKKLNHISVKSDLVTDYAKKNKKIIKSINYSAKIKSRINKNLENCNCKTRNIEKRNKKVGKYVKLPFTQKEKLHSYRAITVNYNNNDNSQKKICEL